MSTTATYYIKTAAGDVRKAMTTLEKPHRSGGTGSIGKRGIEEQLAGGPLHDSVQAQCECRFTDSSDGVWCATHWSPILADVKSLINSDSRTPYNRFSALLSLPNPVPDPLKHGWVRNLRYPQGLRGARGERTSSHPLLLAPGIPAFSARFSDAFVLSLMV